MDTRDAVVVGAGVVGLSTAARLAENGVETVILVQHDLIGSETSSRNSEVIHAGIYYPKDSVKADLCVRGKHLLYEHCQAYHVPFRNCGKIIVASKPEQTETVRGYIDKAAANGVADLVWLSADEVNELEPEVAAVGGVLSPSTGIIDSHSYMVSLQGILESCGGMVAFNTAVIRLHREGSLTVVETEDFSVRCKYLINSAGLHAPLLAAQLSPAPEPYYAKGHYYGYSGRQPFSRLVYPVAEPGGLGVHVTLDMAGQVKFGPDVCWIDNIDYDFDESQFAAFVSAIQAYYPGLDDSRLRPDYTGIRPKIAASDAGFVDFNILGPAHHGVPGLVNLLGIESPGLTASLAIAEVVAEELGLNGAI
jgi:L-2-hydroxyglutarate oxidase LhgO